MTVLKLNFVRHRVVGRWLGVPLVRRVLLGILLFIAVTGILALDFYQRPVELQVGMPSPADFRADRTINYVDETRTEELRETAARLVEPVYDPDLAVNSEVLADLGQLFVITEEIRAETDGDRAGRRNQLVEELPLTLSEEKLDTLLDTDEEVLVELEERARSLVQGVLEEGIREQELSQTQSTLEEEIAGLSLREEEKELLVAITTESIRPNLVLNEVETEERRQKARASVQPVERTIVEGLRIVREGDLITQEHLDQLQALGLHHNLESFRVRVVGLGVLVLVMMALGSGYLCLYKRQIWDQEGYLALLGLIMIVNLSLARLLTLIPNPLYGYLIPIAAGSMLVAILLDNHLGVLFTVVMSVFVGIASGWEVQYPLVATVGGLVGTFSVSQLNQRMDLTRTGLFVAGANVVTIAGIGLFTLRPWQEVSLGTFLGMINGVLAAVLAIGLLPYLEKGFNLTTAVRLFEISNPNHPLLKRLLLEAPGTYHHSILVGNLAEAAAEVVGADPLLVRAGAYYHDIGKLRRPYFFIENQVFKENPHDKISPNLSALIISSHAKDGVELAKEYQLPQVIQDIILQHHGTSLMAYFFHRAQEIGKEQKLAEEDFRYPGPKPQTKEAAIVMLADSVEAGVRSLAKPNPNRIQGMVQKLVKERLHDGQLDECDLTFRDLDAIAAAFSQVLAGIFHTRIEYPEQLLEQKGGEPNAGSDPESPE